MERIELQSHPPPLLLILLTLAAVASFAASLLWALGIFDLTPRWLPDWLRQVL